jgi:hypothetical protein
MSKDGGSNEMHHFAQKDFFHPVFPFPYNKKLFCLCRSCVIEQNTTGECQHLSDTERCIDGTWVIDEVRLAVTKGYKILEILEVYQYEVIQYNPETGDEGLFVEYINTFLKLKAEASGYPSWVRTPAYEINTLLSSMRAKAFSWIVPR